MKILFVCDVLGEENNGTTIAAFNVIRFLKSRGHDVRILCCDQNRKGQPGIYVCPTLNVGPFNNYVKKNGVSLASADKQVIEDAFKDIDIVHVMVPFVLGHYCGKYAFEHNVPLTAGFHVQAENVTNHFFIMNLKFANLSLYRAFYKLLYRYCDHIHYPSQFIRDTFEKVVGPTPGYVISNGVKSEFRRLPDVVRPAEFQDKFIILMVGRYSKEKNQMLLLKAVLKSVHKDNIQIILAGEGPLKDKYIKFCKKYTVKPILKFYNHDEIVNIMNIADLYVHTASVDLEAISALEALSCGLVPVINFSPKSAVKNYALSMHNLFKFNSSKDLAKKIDYWYEHPNEKKLLSDRYIEYTKKYNFDECMSRMENMFLTTIEEHKNKQK